MCAHLAVDARAVHAAGHRVRTLSFRAVHGNELSADSPDEDPKAVRRPSRVPALAVRAYIYEGIV